MSSHRASLSGNVLKIAGYKHQADAVITQLAVQNTWYTVLNITRNVRLYGIEFDVTAFDETIEVKITIDAQILLASQAAILGTPYFPYLNLSAFPSDLFVTTTDPMNTRSFLLEGRTIKVEIRKTTAAGASSINCHIKYAKIP